MTYLNSHPAAGILLSGTFLTTGTAMPLFHAPDQIPVIYMQAAQLTFWGVGALFAYLTYKKKK